MNLNEIEERCNNAAGEKSAAQVLREAAEYLRERGWVQGGFGPRGREQCAYGAIRMCAGWDRPDRWSAYLALESYTVSVFGRGVIAFNDTKGRTKDEVLAALEAAATRAEGAFTRSGE